MHWLLLLALVATPEDPFKDEYLPPVPTEVGAAPHQLRLVLSGGVVHLVPDLALTASVEWMASGWLGVRATAMVQLSRFGAAPHLLEGRVGPNLHFLPWRRVDLGIFFEGGIAALDVVEATRGAAPVVVAGGFFDVHLNSFLFLHAQGEVQWLVRPAGGHLFSPAAWLGLGVGL